MATIRETLADINALPYVSARYVSETGEFRVTLSMCGSGLPLRERQRRQEDVACYTEDAADALGTARYMSAQEERNVGARLGIAA